MKRGKIISNSLDDVKYDGVISNKKVVRLENAHEKYRKMLERIQKQIQEIQNDCDHEYMFYCSGAYDDTYICRICRHTKEF